jgi:outer membrane lipoprotein-sorting protein
MAPSSRRRRLRWLAPFATAAVIALLAAAPGLSSASTPSLPAITAQQLLVKMQQAHVTALSGTIDLNANLGIPDLSELNDAAGDGGSVSGTTFSPTDLLSGSHQALVWLDGPTRERVDLLESSAETDLIHNGANVWLWDSTTKSVTHQTLTAHVKDGTKDLAKPAAAAPQTPMKTPQQLANDLLAQVTPSTTVSVASNVSVAGRSAYQLILAPHAATSTIDHIAIAVDSATGLPLRVQVFSRSQKSAVVTLGFGSIHFSTPAASEFAFTPPPGSQVTTGTIGHAVVPGSGPQLRTVRVHHLGHHVIKSVTTAPLINGNPAAAKAAEKETTVGHDWTSVAIISNIQLPAQLSQYFSAGTAVHGAFGTGRLIGSPLVNVLILNDGRMAVGAVSPAALEAAVATAAP